VSIREVRPGYWEIRVYAGVDKVTGKQRQISRSISGTKRDATRREAALITELAEDPLVDTAGSFAHVATQVIDHLEQIGRSPTTIIEYRRLLKTRIKPQIGSVPVRDLTSRHLDQMYGRFIRGGLSPSSVEKVHRLVHLILARAVKWEWVSRNVATTATPPPVHRDQIVPPSVEDVQTLLAEARRHNDPDIGIAMLLLAATGCRRGELVGLQWRDIDLEGATVRIERAVVKVTGQQALVKPTKTHRARVVPVGPMVVSDLAAYRFSAEERAALCDVELRAESFLFSLDPDGERPWHPTRVTHAWAAIRKRCGLDPRLHDLRHWSASTLLAGGESMTKATSRLGHSKGSTTANIYSHLVPGDVDHAPALLDSKLYPA
jgi:integrase